MVSDGFRSAPTSDIAESGAPDPSGTLGLVSSTGPLQSRVEMAELRTHMGDQASAGRVAVFVEDPSQRRAVEDGLRQAGYRVLEHVGVRSLLAQAVAPEALVVQVGHPDQTRFSELFPGTPSIGLGTDRDEDWYELVPENAPERLAPAARRAVERMRLGRMASSVPRLVAQSAEMLEVVRQVNKVAPIDATVALRGERGTGKDLVARAIHGASARAERPFVPIHCASLPESAHEVELFGVASGGMPGVTESRRGRLEEADGGTLYLDEVDGLSALTQASLLRALQESAVRRVGSSEVFPVDVRVICSSTEDLEDAVKAGRFREDLYFRLVVYPIRVPPLRERRDDIPELVRRCLLRFSVESGRSAPRVAPSALDAMMAYDWPSNVRQLENALQRAMIAAERETLQLSDFPSYLSELAAPSGSASESEIVPLADLERSAIRRALEATGGSVDRAAKLLGMGRATLYRRLAKYEGS